MSAHPGFELIFADTDSSHSLAKGAGERGRHTVHVARTSASGPGGHPVYVDSTGIIRAEISEQGEVRMLASGFGQKPQQPVGCVRSRDADADALPEPSASA
ncbi:DUF6296 family protein [Streptomyces sp. SPB162]|uniref:DUF6296 family protein n=1 Tax=Streptomyces sp. SPB162 TaxID=2940560 RepID=UPI0024065C07|nr:DUF6296 family protein [Streptomyces sp. SPB162]MDF9816409.1 hypothetical protein [Streptomyces sp. SPB162]